MNKSDDEIIEVADEWKKRELELKRLKINLADGRRRAIIGNIFDIPGLLLLIAIVIITPIIFVDCQQSVIDCTDADQDRLERMLTTCESSNDTTRCHGRVVEVLCKEIIVSE